MPSFLLFGQKDLAFIEEYIDFSIGKTGFETNGIYVFTNNSDKTIARKIQFPFAMETDSVNVLRVYNFSYNKNIPYQTLKKSISFMLEIEVADTVYINIAYTQTLLKNNVYILRSTKAWGKPLQKAQYSLTVHDSLLIEDMSYPADSQKDNVYYWEKTDFMPTKDFEVVLSD
jgi:hypothetical protein